MYAQVTSLTKTKEHLFNALYLASGGVIVYTNWVDQYVENKEAKFLLEFAACAVSMISLVRQVLLGPLVYCCQKHVTKSIILN